MVQKVLAVPDLHAPYHSEAAFRLAIKVGRKFFQHTPPKDRIIVVMGDFIDGYPISQFPKTRRASFEEEIAVARECLDELESLGAKRLEYLEGNHEARLTKYLANKCPELFGMFPKIPTLLKLDRWRWHPYHTLLKLGKAYFSHDFGGSGGLSHIKAMMDVDGNSVQGHTHHTGIHYRGNLKGSAHFGASLGWLGDPEQIDYANRAKVAHWTHNVGLGYLYPNGHFHLSLCPFVSNSATVEGKLVTL